MHLITYISQSKSDTSIEEITAISAKNNAADNITGALFHLNGHFLQVLEGEEARLRKLVERIKSDDRHKNFNILIDERVDERGFKDWDMGYFDLEDEEKFSLSNMQKLTYGFKKNLLTRSDKLIDFYKAILR